MTRNPRHKNQVRIIGGSCRSRVIRFEDADGLRPSADSVRERLFNWLGQDLSGKNVLDLFSGSGVMGFEAASRGAAHTVMVECNPKVFRVIADNLDLLHLSDVVLHCADALDYLENTAEKFDIVLLDPPYVWQNWDGLWQELHHCLNANAEVYAESDRAVDVPDFLTVRKSGRSGISHFVLARAAVAVD